MKTELVQSLTGEHFVDVTKMVNPSLTPSACPAPFMRYHRSERRLASEEKKSLKNSGALAGEE